ncbi:hypothetical protein [Noviherbaspirillum galbum]|uniref:Lipoprotein n=1 Tax=Noviherbaspirillum galbum TaxID=2709383 RepID=A0A6B3SXI0_9BURK|nr:hypothetical protein [Noviherbaspirillum galbum]NEX63212.1 hypothetical protein [Noviherbaspirillum galbum]
MNRTILIMPMLAGALLAAGCQKTPEPKTSDAAKPSVNADVPLAKTSDQSVALPKDKLPPSDASMSPKAGAGATSSGDSGTPSQVRPEQLSKEQEQSSMPLNGQTNNYSPPNTTPPDKTQ